MSTTVAQHQLTAFTDPSNGDSPIDADTVKGNDNTIRSGFNDHDADTGIHVQSSVSGSRPSAGTSGRKWMTVDSLSAPTVVELSYDDGTNWYGATYLPLAGGSLTGDLTITDTTGPQLKVGYDGTNRLSISVASNGDTTLAGTVGADLVLSSWTDITLPGGVISYGANDSGGSGYRVVVVPNA